MELEVANGAEAPHCVVLPVQVKSTVGVAPEMKFDRFAPVPSKATVVVFCATLEDSEVCQAPAPAMAAASAAACNCVRAETARAISTPAIRIMAHQLTRWPTTF